MVEIDWTHFFLNDGATHTLVSDLKILPENDHQRLLKLQQSKVRGFPHLSIIN
jgi:hypothetical protein